MATFKNKLPTSALEHLVHNTTIKCAYIITIKLEAVILLRS
jgi:hypothetical protein